MKIELNKNHCMDCLEGMKQMEDKSVDLIVTDPPYNINLKPQRGLTASILNDNMGKVEFKNFLRKVFEQIKRVLKDNSFLIIFISWSTIPLFREVLDSMFTLKSMPIWVKNNFGIGYYTRPQYEPCFLYMKGEPKSLKKPVSDVWKFNKVLAPIHSCEKPIKLMNFIVKTFSINKDDLILDPFMGSGTTAVACKQLGRNFIGFEISQKYVDIANKRLSQKNILQTLEENKLF